MTDISEAVNIGNTLAGDLRRVGIPSVERLRALGPDAAALRMREAGLHDCSHSYLALVGAIRGERWPTIEQTERTRLSARARELDELA
jgi:TfoX C-terminal domain